ncbi:hypothetical protein FA13DRAFT_1743126 [Coprinellus micaceus]|uniref:Uncharacterized protein n=1 Tax=Coprinellus micaceus TaxID=71717 RepID=A0A4Y7SGT1_COPMI|nr:hypothetical protein FA13DRAFT_1743126 [Coprinellus micaceus]
MLCFSHGDDEDAEQGTSDLGPIFLSLELIAAISRDSALSSTTTTPTTAGSLTSNASPLSVEWSRPSALHLLAWTLESAEHRVGC